MYIFYSHWKWTSKHKKVPKTKKKMKNSPCIKLFDIKKDEVRKVWFCDGAKEVWNLYPCSLYKNVRVCKPKNTFTYLFLYQGKHISTEYIFFRIMFAYIFFSLFIYKMYLSATDLTEHTSNFYLFSFFLREIYERVFKTLI